MKKILLAATALALTAGATAKKALDHDAFDSWKSVNNSAMTRDGAWSAFIVSPQEGDGVLTIRNTRSGKEIVIPRGYKPQFTSDGRWLIASVKPLFAATRQAKIDKKKPHEMPLDSLAIIDLRSGERQMLPAVAGFKTGKEGGDWVAYTSLDTIHIKPAALKDKEGGRPLVIRHLPTGREKVIKNVSAYTIDERGTKVAFSMRRQEKDSTSTDGVGYVTLSDTTLTLLDRDRLHYGAPVFNTAGTALAFTADNDSAESGTRRMELMLADLSVSTPAPRRMVSSVAAPKELYVNQYSTPVFSHDGRRLIIGVAPEVAPDDTTIVDFERADLDIWRWDAPYTPPQELNAVDKERKRTFPLVMRADGSGTPVLLTDNALVSTEEPDRWDGEWALLRDPSEDIVSFQWNYVAPEAISLVNLDSGERRALGKAWRESSELSPAGKFVLCYGNGHYYTYSTATGDSVCITAPLPYPVWDEDNDRPMPSEPYGMAGWTEDDARVLIYDRHDIWSLDPTGKEKPQNLTAGSGRERNLRFRVIDTDKEARFLRPGDDMLLSVFSYDDKRNGLASLRLGRPAAPDIRTLEEYQFTQVLKARDASVYTFSKQNFSTSPDLYVRRGTDFAKADRITDINPQMAEYSWGTAHLFKWRNHDGGENEGVLYLPEDFDPEGSYPLMSVFYETNAEELYRHYAMVPSWSWINYPFYVSRGYVVFVPDVHYTAGIPGEGACNCILSGIEELCRQYPAIDRSRIGIDGQSWGGYQTAYLITRTDMFACAGSGAPVANMTSAYGGIRWSTGDSRQAQYEQGQSRIGRSLWEAPELYIANSPLFHLDKVNTPLLIMHNDADGAVPWYQGIELFMGLRRLQKPVWMLTYNGEAHNLKQRKNCKDITIRLQQFFDHYLKGAPMPEWMKNGIPATRKGQEMGYGL